MGTNYYLRQDHCYECGRWEEIHIGKSSAGWRFALSGLIYGSYGSWLTKLVDAKFVWNEYGEQLPTKTLIDLIDHKKDHRQHEFTRDHPGHPDGPVDLCMYEFS